jgi:hypothetical protein
MACFVVVSVGFSPQLHWKYQTEKETIQEVTNNPNQMHSSKLLKQIYVKIKSLNRDQTK